MPIIRFDGANDELAVLDSPILDGTSGIDILHCNTSKQFEWSS